MCGGVRGWIASRLVVRVCVCVIIFVGIIRVWLAYICMSYLLYSYLIPYKNGTIIRVWLAFTYALLVTRSIHE